METFQHLKIVLPLHEKDDFFSELEGKIERSAWKVRHDLITNYKRNTFTSDKNVLCAQSPSYALDGKIITGLLWFREYSDYYEVLNIVPTQTGNLSFKEYNHILNSFYIDFIKELSIEYNADITLTEPEKLLIETIGKNAYSALIKFSSEANKNTGNIHPYDFDRWCQFIFIIFKKQIKLSSTELESWLLENGWDDNLSSKLALEFEYSIDLLEKYEQNS